jgi:hypothetical protein
MQWCNQRFCFHPAARIPTIERLNSDGGELHGQWETIPEEPILSRVSYVGDNVISAIRPWTDDDYRLDSEEDGRFWPNHEQLVLLALGGGLFLLMVAQGNKTAGLSPAFGLIPKLTLLVGIGT